MPTFGVKMYFKGLEFDSRIRSSTFFKDLPYHTRINILEAGSSLKDISVVVQLGKNDRTTDVFEIDERKCSNIEKETSFNIVDTEINSLQSYLPIKACNIGTNSFWHEALSNNFSKYLTMTVSCEFGTILKEFDYRKMILRNKTQNNHTLDLDIDTFFVILYEFYNSPSNHIGVTPSQRIQHTEGSLE